MLLKLNDYRPKSSNPNLNLKSFKQNKFSIINFIKTFQEVNEIYNQLNECRKDFTKTEIEDAFEKIDLLLLSYDQNIEPLFRKMNDLYRFINTNVLDDLSTFYLEKINNKKVGLN